MMIMRIYPVGRMVFAFAQAGAVVLLLFGQAEAVVNPTAVEFVASTDHDTVLSEGEPAVTRYELRWYATGTSAPFQVTDLGKPTKPPTGPIHVDLGAVFGAVPLGLGYTVRVVAIGPGGTSGDSNTSNLFDRVGPPRAPSGVTVVP